MNPYHSHLDRLVEEILEIDPALQAKETEVRRVVEHMLALQKDIEPNPFFIAKLRQTLREQEKRQHNSLDSLFSFFMNNKQVLGVSLGAFVIALGVGSYYLAGTPNSLGTPRQQPLAMQALGAEAFGSLVSPAVTGLPPESARTMMVQKTGAGGGSGGDVALDAKMIAPNLVEYTYVYEGDESFIPENMEELTVFLRNKNTRADGQGIFALANRFFPTINLTPLANARVQNVSLVQDVKEGYGVYIDFDEARVSVNPNYIKWYGADVCGGTPCNEQMLTVHDIPADDQLIRLANAFLNEYDVYMAQYGAPMIDTSWKTNVNTDGTYSYIPDTISVIYPLILGGHQIVEGYGTQPFGLRVNVDLRRDKVQGMWNLLGGSYAESKYPLETDVARIKKFALSGGYLRGPIFYDNINTEISKKTVKLGTPTVVYQQQTVYSEKDQTSRELYVPSLSFPVMNMSDLEPYMSSAVIVPLPKELLDEREQSSLNIPMPADGPVMLMREAQ
jgi:hypothetical protein